MKETLIDTPLEHCLGCSATTRSYCVLCARKRVKLFFCSRLCRADNLLHKQFCTWSRIKRKATKKTPLEKIKALLNNPILNQGFEELDYDNKCMIWRKDYQNKLVKELLLYHKSSRLNVICAVCNNSAKDQNEEFQHICYMEIFLKRVACLDINHQHMVLSALNERPVYDNSKFSIVHYSHVLIVPELVGLVISHLNLGHYSIFALRCVCKAWKKAVEIYLTRVYLNSDATDDDLQIISGFQSVKELICYGCREIRSFQSLSLLSTLTYLNISKTRAPLSPEILVQLKNLTKLDISNRSNFPVNTLKVLPKLSNLRAYFTYSPDYVNFSSFPSLTKLNVGGWNLVTRDICDIGCLTNLVRLNISGPVYLYRSNVLDFDHISGLVNLTKLKALYLEFRSFSKITNLRNLIVLDLSKAEIPSNLDALAKLDELQVLKFGLPQNWNIPLGTLRSESLIHLSIQEKEENWDSMEFLQNFPKLKSLTTRYPHRRFHSQFPWIKWRYDNI